MQRPRCIEYGTEDFRGLGEPIHRQIHDADLLQKFPSAHDQVESKQVNKTTGSYEEKDRSQRMYGT